MPNRPLTNYDDRLDVNGRDRFPEWPATRIDAWWPTFHACVSGGSNRGQAEFFANCIHGTIPEVSPND